jgi:signal transduction histidine kinase
LRPRTIKLHTSLSPSLPPITTDGAGLKQVVINLIRNAAEAMPQGGRIDLATRLVPSHGKRIIGAPSETPVYLEITIRDNGPGIPASIKKRLFEPFNSTKGDKHAGVGLAIVHSIVKKLDGNIVCESSKGLGTCFKITLPTV